MFRTTPQATTGAFRGARRADDLVAYRAGDQIAIADDVVAAGHFNPMFFADRASTCHAACDASRAALETAHVTGQQACGDAVAGGTLHDAGRTVRRAVYRVEMVETRPDRAPAIAAGDKAILTESLAAGVTNARLRAELLAAGAAHGT